MAFANGSDFLLSESVEIKNDTFNFQPRIDDNFHNWISCFCIVTFDLELGQVIEKVFPEKYCLTEIERTNICYLAFPDSNTGCMGDTSFHFRIRSKAKYKINVLNQDMQYQTGYVLFRQVKDESIKRGYFQKSVVLLTRLPYIELFLKLTKLIATAYFDTGDVAMETVCNQISNWPTQSLGKVIQLPVLGDVIELSTFEDYKSNIKSLSYLYYYYQPRLYQCFYSIVSCIQMLWELVLLGEPIVVIAPTPMLCSEGVQTLVSMIHPLHYVCDYRPYFTIHDSEFKEYTTKNQFFPNVILGVTNPYFVKTFQNWPNLIRLGEMSSLTATKIDKKTVDFIPGIYTKYKACLSKDKALVRKIERAIKANQSVETLNGFLCKYVIELTQSFLIPLERYIGSLMPLQRSILPWKSPPKLKKFNIDEFVATLPIYGPHLTSKLKGNWTLLYQKFFKSPNFEVWFCKRRQEVNNKLEILHLEALCNADVNSWTKGKDEVEIVDLYMYVKKTLLYCKTGNVYVSPSIRHDLHSQLLMVLKALPSDLQEVLKKSL
ncbi:protein DENND6A [Hydra vulgaris]|uniref:protein DENND6A n=1 Tax=Hydra vulgaris TaxID=6087 RepID=UPI001F5FA639|nr:protein DENND6A isoform X1 [Hydra vulgaris]